MTPATNAKSKGITTDAPLAPLSLQSAPALIERLLPVQKLSVEAYKEQMANTGKTLTALGSYWKGRKPLVLNKACVLASLLPATGEPAKDLEVFELLMGMDDAAMKARLVAARRLKGSEPLPRKPYRELVRDAKRPEELGDALFEPIWDRVNAHLGTRATSFPELVEQLGVARFGRCPVVADTFCGSGQIPFEAARLGCDVIASDLNPIACMLTWGAMHIVGGSPKERERLERDQKELAEKVQAFVDDLDIETAEFDGGRWRARAYLYCVEVRCPSSGWMVPMLPTRQISKTNSTIIELIPDHAARRYSIHVRDGASEREMKAAKTGTVVKDSLVHTIDGHEHRTSLKTLRGDFEGEAGGVANRLRHWERSDWRPRPDDLYQERLYAVQWQKDGRKSGGDYAFRDVTEEDLERERRVEQFVAEHFEEWQREGWIPDVRIEPGYNTNQPIRERGWTYWHHLFNPRQLLVNGLIRRLAVPELLPLFPQCVQCNSRLSRWDNSAGGREAVKQVFDNQALNTLINYGCRGHAYALREMSRPLKQVKVVGPVSIKCQPAASHSDETHIAITDPPYGDAVKYEEILEFFIAWLGKNPPPEFADWTWDSRRSLAIHGEDESFRQGMVAAYRRMTECLDDHGLQVIMFTHQSGRIWADMANIVWASGLQVTAAWYVVTETDSAIRKGSNVKGTVLLVLRKRQGSAKTGRDDLAWEIEEEVKRQVDTLTGLNQQAKGLYRDENLFGEADLQMAGYAAALRVLTQYAIVDGRDMAEEAIRPRVKKQRTFVDELIDFAVGVANNALVPRGIEETHWRELKPMERFYLKMLSLEAQGLETLDNYQNFAKAFKVADFRPVMHSAKANKSRLKSAAELKRAEMGEGGQFYGGPLRAILYAIMELGKDVDSDDVLAHLAINVPNYYAHGTRDLIVALCQYLAATLEAIRPDEASSARVLGQSVRNQRM